MQIETYYWHSINIIPHIASYSICRDTGFEITGRVLVFKISRYYSSPMIGPIYSRKKKTWKLLNDFTRF